MDAEIVEEGDLGVRRGRRSNARLVEELAETAVGAAKKDTARGGQEGTNVPIEQGRATRKKHIPVARHFLNRTLE